MKYDINLKNENYFTVEVEDGAPAPELCVYYDDNIGKFLLVENLPNGWSVNADEVLYIEPSED